MWRAVIIGAAFAPIATKTALADVASCYACAGPQSDCVANNRSDFLKMDCNTFTVEGESLVRRTAEATLLEKFDSEVGARTDTEIGCLTLTFTNDVESPRERAVKSCVPARVLDQDICKYMENLVDFIGGQETSCHFCKKDNCNSAISVSVGTHLIFVLCATYLYNCLLS
jgi:hypothetical protein